MPPSQQPSSPVCIRPPPPHVFLPYIIYSARQPLYISCKSTAAAAAAAHSFQIIYIICMRIIYGARVASSPYTSDRLKIRTRICIRKHLEILLALRNVYTRDSTYSCILMNIYARLCGYRKV